MTDNIAFIIAIITGTITFITLFITKFIKLNTKATNFKEQAIKNGCVVTADKIKSSIRGPYGDNEQTYEWTVIYQYIVNNKEYKKKLKFQGTFGTIDFPFKVQIYYDPKRPSKCISDVEADKSSQRAKIFPMIIIISIITTAIIYNLLKFIFKI